MFINRRSTATHQRGDTIIEVLIAVGIVSLILTSSYMLANRNSQTMQNVREQTQAQKLVERQIELLRSSANLDGFKSGTNRCFQSTGVPAVLAADCTLNVNGDRAAATDGAQYRLLITYDAPRKVYRVTADWNKLGGSTANVTMYYYYE